MALYVVGTALGSMCFAGDGPHLLLRLLTAVGNVTGAVIMMFTINVWLTLIFLVFAIGSSFVTKVVAHKTLVLAAERQRSVGILTGHVEEAYSGRAIIRASTRRMPAPAASTRPRRIWPTPRAAPTS